MLKLNRLHYWLGITGILLFILTGQYMDRVHGHLQGMADAPRMLYRSAHIYILLTSVITLALSFLPISSEKYRTPLHYLLSAFVVAALALFTVAFFVEPNLSDLNRPYTRFGVYAILGMGLILSFLGIKNNTN